MSFTVVATSPRVAPGLLSAAAWGVLRGGLPVLAAEGHPQRAALAEAGIDVRSCAPDAGAVREAYTGGAVWLALEGDGMAEALGAEVVVGSFDLPGAHLLDAVAVMDRLRSPGGCPWDAEQTHASLMPYLLEEAYEAYQALEDEDDDELREELGDLLLQILFHARISTERDGGWSVDDVADGLVHKLVSRHPHVFGDVEVSGADEVNARWEQLKAEQKGRTSVTEGVPLAMSSLALAAKLRRRAARLGTGPVAAFAAGDGLGAALWALSSDEAETDLRAVARRFRDELFLVETTLIAEGFDPAALSDEEWRERWPR